MSNKIEVDSYYPDEITGSDKYKLILNMKNLGAERIIIKDIRPMLPSGKISFYDTSSTHLDLDYLSFDQRSLYDEMWMQVIDASKIILKKENPVKYYITKLFKSIGPFMPKLLYNIYFEDLYKELYPNEFYINSFYLENDNQLNILKQDYINNLSNNSEIKKAFHRNEEELKRINKEISQLEKNTGRKYGKIIESNQYIKVPMEFLCDYKWKYSKESFIISITYEDDSGELSTISEEINLNIKPSKKTVIWGALLGVFITMILVNHFNIIWSSATSILYSTFIDSGFLVNALLAFLLSLLTYDDNQGAPIKAEGIFGGFLIGVISVIGKDKLLEILTTIIDK